MNRELLQQVLEALSLAHKQASHEMLLTGEELRRVEKSIGAVRAALASPEQPASDEIKLPELPETFKDAEGLDVFYKGDMKAYAKQAVELNRKPASEDKPVAHIEGVYGGTVVITPVDWSIVWKKEMPLYTHPAPADQDARDAARYRWLRDKAASDEVEHLFWMPDVDAMESTIDAAIERAGEKK